MFFNIPLSHDIDHYCQKIDDHIKEDFETKVPDYGEEPFRPKGFHFKRNKNSVKGIYRYKYIKHSGTVGAFLSPSTHMHFNGKMITDKKGERRLRVFIYPQLSQAFMLVLSLAFALLFTRDITKTYFYVIFFAVVFMYSVVETVKISVAMKKEFHKFFD